MFLPSRNIFWTLVSSFLVLSFHFESRLGVLEFEAFLGRVDISWFRARGTRRTWPGVLFCICLNGEWMRDSFKSGKDFFIRGVNFPLFP